MISYTLVTYGGTERQELTGAEYDQIIQGVEYERQGVRRTVSAVIFKTSEDDAPELVAYKDLDTDMWRYVPQAFRGMTYEWE